MYLLSDLQTRLSTTMATIVALGFANTRICCVLLVTTMLLCNYGPPATLAQENDRVRADDDWDYPLLNEIPNTGFECTGRIPGYYADDHPGSLCQVFHYCHHDGRIFDFLCPNTTIFNQKVFACDHFYNFECETAKDFYYLNDVFLNGSVNDTKSN